MLAYIISWIIVISFTIFVIKKLIKMYKQAESLVEKIMYILGMIVWFIPWIIYFLDSKDILTLLGYTKNINTDRWFDFIGNYITGIVSTIISGVILWIITRRQIDEQINNDKENRRIQNAPIFDYNITNSEPSKINYKHAIEVKENGELYNVYFFIENIGLNHARNISFLIKINKKKDRKFSLNGHQSFIKSGDIVTLNLIFELNGNNVENRDILIEVSYEDLLKNKYIQKVKATLIPVNLPVVRRVNIKDYVVEDAKYIKNRSK